MATMIVMLIETMMDNVEAEDGDGDDVGTDDGDDDDDDVRDASVHYDDGDNVQTNDADDIGVGCLVG